MVSWYAQPVKLPIVRELEDELIDHTVDSNGTTDKIKRRIRGVVEDEVVSVESRKTASSNASGQLLIPVSKRGSCGGLLH